MGIVRNPANTMRRGRVGETTYYISGGQQIARQALNGSNFGETARRSDAQQKRRVLWANLVNFYKVSRNWMPKAFETKKRNQSDYNKFMQLNINSARIALTKAEAEAGTCVVDQYIVSQGSLPSIEIKWNTRCWVTNIAVGDLEIDSSTTVADFSKALVDNNGNIRYGMQLSFVSYQQNVDVMGIARAICRCYEVTLDQSNSVPLFASFPDFCASTSGKFLSTSSTISVGGFAYILSEQTSTGLAVSTQQLVNNNEMLVDEYSSEAHRAAAINSYGLDKEVVLSPAGTVLQDPEAQPIYLTRLRVGGNEITRNGYAGTMNSLHGKSLVAGLSAVPKEQISYVCFEDVDGGQLTVSNVTFSGGQVNGTISNDLDSTSPAAVFIVELSDGTELRWPLSTSETDGDL